MSSLSLIQFSNYLIPLILIPYVSRVVGVDNYGTLEYARAFILYFTIFIDYGFNYTATREVSINRYDKGKLNAIFSQIMFSKVMLFIIASLSFYGLILYDDTLHEIKYVLWITYMINIGFVLFPIWFYQGIEKIAFVASINFIIKIIILALTLLLLKEKSDFWIYNFLQSVAQIVAGLFSLLYAFKKYEVKLIKIKLVVIKDRLREGFPLFISTLLSTIIGSFSFLVLKLHVDDNTLGVYSTAFKLVITIQTLLLVPFSQAFFPYMANLVTKDIDAYRKKIKQASRLLLLLNLGVLAICYVFAKYIILLLFGSEYLLAVTPFRSFLLLPLLVCLANVYSYQGLLTLKKDKTFMYIYVVFALITIISNVLFIPIYGIYGAIVLRVLVEFGLFFTSYLFYLKYMKKDKAL